MSRVGVGSLGLAVMPGALLALAFPGTGGQGWRAFGAPVPLLVTIDEAPWWRARVLGGVAGLSFWLTTISWIIVGFSLVFVALGASVSAIGQALFAYRGWITCLGGILIMVFGPYIAGVFKLGVLGRTAQWRIREKPAGYAGSLAVGVTFAIGWTPCVGPILGAILSLAGTTDTVQRGMGLIIAYSAGLGLSFLLSAAALGSFLSVFKRYRRWIPIVERAAGVLLVVGIMVSTNYFLVLNSWALSLTPDWLLRRL